MPAWSQQAVSVFVAVARPLAQACLVALALAGCGCGAARSPAPATIAPRLVQTGSPGAGAPSAAGVAGTVPRALPARLLLGLVETAGDTWMRDSAVPWDVRYAYFTDGWIDGWGSRPADGSWGLAYLRECVAHGFIPAVTYYQMLGEPGGGEGAFLSKARSPATMASYFANFRTLLQVAKQAGGPVIIHLEPDGFGYLQQKSHGDPHAYAAVGATGLPELQGLPDTIAGWGLAFLQLRKAVGAHDVVLGIHVSSWASGKDVAAVSVRAPLQPEVDATYAFLSPLGLAPNVTDETYDVLVGDPLDRDADYYKLTQRSDRWWDPSDDAPVGSRSFNRYAEWMRLWNHKAGKRWVIWQIPVGNSNHLNVLNRGGPRQGYRDNRPEYFFGPRSDGHLEKWARAGAIALLFGPGMDGMSSYTNDQYFDGQLFLRSRVGALLRGGPLLIPLEPGEVALRPKPWAR